MISFALALLSVIVVIFFALGLRGLFEKKSTVDRFTYNPTVQAPKQVVRRTRAGFKIKRSLAVVLAVSGGIFVALLVYLIAGVGWLSVIASLSGLFFPKVWVQWHIRQNKTFTARQMRHVCDLAAMICQTGGDLASALENASASVKEPLSTRLKEVSVLYRSGKPLKELIVDLEEELEIKELEMLVIAADLADNHMPVDFAITLKETGEMIQTRLELEKRRSIASNSAKWNYYLVAALPYFTLMIMRQMSPDMVEPLFNTLSGFIGFTIGSCFVFLGLWRGDQISEMKPL